MMTRKPHTRPNKLYNTMYTGVSRERYPEFDTLDPLHQQYILNQIYKTDKQPARGSKQYKERVQERVRLLDNHFGRLPDWL